MSVYILGQTGGFFTVSYTFGGFAIFVLGVLLCVLIGGGAFFVSKDNNKPAVLLLTGAIAVPLPLVYTSCTTYWIDDHEFGLAPGGVMTTGACPFVTTGGMSIPRNDPIHLIQATNIGDIEIVWTVVEPKKLVESYREIRSFNSSGSGTNSDSKTFNQWVSVRLASIIPKGRQLLLPVEESSQTNEEFAREVAAILEPYGLKTRISVTKNFVIDLRERPKDL